MTIVKKSRLFQAITLHLLTLSITEAAGISQWFADNISIPYLSKQQNLSKQQRRSNLIPLSLTPALPDCTNPKILRFIQKLCKQGNVEQPILVKIAEGVDNAWVARINKQYFIILGTGLIQEARDGCLLSLSDASQAIIAHELGHIANADTASKSNLSFIRTLPYMYAIPVSLALLVAARSDTPTSLSRKCYLACLAGLGGASIAIALKIGLKFLNNLIFRHQESQADIFSASLVGPNKTITMLKSLPKNLLCDLDTTIKDLELDSLPVGENNVVDLTPFSPAIRIKIARLLQLYLLDHPTRQERIKLIQEKFNIK